VFFDKEKEKEPNDFSVIQFWRPSWLYLKNESFVKEKLGNDLLPKYEIKKQTQTEKTPTSKQTQTTASTTTTPTGNAKKRKQEDH
jgi:hypothetical protein